MKTKQFSAYISTEKKDSGKFTEIWLFGISFGWTPIHKVTCGYNLVTFNQTITITTICSTGFCVRFFHSLVLLVDVCNANQIAICEQYGFNVSISQFCACSRILNFNVLIARVLKINIIFAYG